jgi:acetyltransferase-like isoleucine patch superfamily enzyme
MCEDCDGGKCAGDCCAFDGCEEGEGCIIADDVEIGAGVKIGHYCVIEAGTIIGDDVTIGNMAVIGQRCVIGARTVIEHHVLLKASTVIGTDCYVDSYVKSSGMNRIGNLVTLRFNATIAREVTVEDSAFVAPNVMTIYSTHEGEKRPGTVIGAGAHIGTNAVIGPAVNIAPGAVVGALAYVAKDLPERAIYVGLPARKLRDLE